MTMPGGGSDRQVNVTVNANVDPFVRSMTAANTATLKLGTALKTIDDRMVSLTKKLGVTAMGVGGAGLLGAFGDVKQAAALQQSFSSLAAQATQTGTKVGDISTGIQKMSTNIPVATSQLAAMATQIAALGVTGTQNILTLTKQAEQLAAATNTAPGQLFTQLIQMNQSLGGSIQNLERYGSVLTTIQNNMGVSAQDTMSFANSIQAVAQKAGISEQNILGLSAAFAKVGADGTSGAQAFNTVMNAMTDAVARNSTTMKQFTQVMGITTDQFKSLVTNSPTQAFVQFIESISAQGSKASITLQSLGLDSTRLQRVFAALTGGQANLSSTLAQSAQAFQQNSATAAAAGAAWDTLDSKIQMLKNGIGQIKDQLGAPLLRPLGAVTDAFTSLTKGVSGFIHFADDAPWPIGDTVTALVTKTPALLLLGGAFITLTAAVSKFAGAWRLMTGATGINAFRGFMDGRGGNMPREMDGNTGRLGSFLYRTTYGMGRGDNMIGVNARRSVGSMIAGYPFMRARQQFGQAADTLAHPFSPEARNAAKTDPLSMYGMFQQGSAKGDELRTRMATNLRNNNPSAFRSALADRLDAGFGEFDDSAEAAKRRRFTYVEQARIEATRQQRDINSTLGRRDLMALVSTAEAGQYYQTNGTLNGYNPTDLSRTSLSRLRKMGNQQAGWVGDSAAKKAGSVYDASLSDEEAAKLANPFQKLAVKVEEITKKLVTTTGNATRAVFSSITTFFTNAMNQISTMAQATIAQIQAVQAAASNPGSAATAAKAAASAAATATSTAASASTNLMTNLIAVPPPVPRTGTAGLPSAEELASQQVIGFPAGTRVAGIGPRRGPGSRNTAPGDVTRGVPSGMEEGGSTGGAALRAGTLRGLATRTFGEGSWVRETALPNVAEAGKSVVTGLGSLASGIKTTLTTLMSPQLMIGAALLGPTIFNLAKKLGEANSLVGTTPGSTTAQALGRQVLTPQQIGQLYQTKNAPSDSTDLFTDTAWKNSQSGNFKSNGAPVLDKLDALKKSNLSDARKQQLALQIIQEEANGDVLNNGGSAVDFSQKQQLAQYAMAYTGSQTTGMNLLGGQGLSKIDLTGQGNGSYYSSIADQLLHSSGDLHEQLLQDFGGQSALSYSGPQGNLAGALSTIAQVQQGSGGNTFVQRTMGGKGGGYKIPVGSDAGFGNQQTADVLKSFIDSYNDKNPNAPVHVVTGTNAAMGQVDSLQGFIHTLQAEAEGGNNGAKGMLDSLTKLGVTFDKTGAITSASLNNLTKAANGSAKALTNGTGITDINGQPLDLQAAYQKIKGDKSANLLSLLNTPDATNYSYDLTRTTQQLYNSKGGTTAGALDPQNAAAFRAEAEAVEKLKQTVASGSPQWQQLDQLEQQLYGKGASAAMVGGGGMVESLKNQTANLQSYLSEGYNVNNATEYQAQLDATDQANQQAVNQLDQYYIQVRDSHIQMQRAAEDHHTQMVRMERDYNRQMGEAQYQFGIQQNESIYQYNLSVTEQQYQFGEQIRQMKYSISQSLGNAGSMVQAQYTQGASSGLTGFKAQTQDLQKSLEAMNGLKAAGVSADAIRVFKLDDPANFAQAQRYLKDFVGNPALVKSFNDEVAKNLSISNAIAQDPNNSQFADLERSFNHTADIAAKSFTHSAEMATAAFDHSMQQSKISYDTQMQDFQADYERSTQRSLADLARLGEDTQKTWQDLVKWAQDSGIPGIEQLGQVAQNSIGLAAQAAGQLNQQLSNIPAAIANALPQVQAGMGNLASMIGNALASTGLFGASSTGSGQGVQQGTKGANQQIVNSIASRYGWSSGAEWNALSTLINNESGWNNNAQNPGSSAYGLFQFLNSTWAGTGFSKSADANVQGNAGLAYIKNRYGDPINALNFWNSHSPHWYGTGAVFNGAQTIGVGERGPEAVIPLDGRGSNFVAQTVMASIQMMNPNLLTEVRRGRTAPFAERAQSNMSYHHTDASTHYNGDITVVAQDPNEMGRKLAAKQRLTRLSRPVGTR